MKTLLTLLFFSVFLFACTKSLDNKAFTEFQLQQVNKGSHYCENHNMLDLKVFSSSIFEGDVKLDTSLFVHSEGSFQNKLLGFYEDQIHKNSARISYHTQSGSDVDGAKDSLVLKAYVYNNGSRNIHQNYCLLKLSRKEVLQNLQHKKALHFSIEITKNNYLFQVGEQSKVKVKRVCQMAPQATKYLCFHYYGGPDSIPAPHNMRLWIKYSPEMK